MNEDYNISESDRETFDTIKEDVIKVGIVQHTFSPEVAVNRQRNLTAIENLANDVSLIFVVSVVV